MGLAQILGVSAAGMNVEQARLQVAASNIANAHTTAGPNGTLYQPLEVVVRPAIVDGMALPVVTGVVPTNVEPKRVYEPGHPDADKDGFVRLPGVDPIRSMMDLMEVSRGYEANLRAFDVTRSLLQRTLDIGSKR